ncbi:hypothetical protein QYM36_010198 [Artemia franciscana]|uniref:Uncharacterized protein n=1 Tax=Artemia franciscana TaxID=6661 RepID=A0AA88HQY3_ARTSF|nr:hypothetical protein QYM36_010198 [Artemia franciscana]
MQLWIISLATVSVAVAAPAFPNDDQFESFSEVYDDNIAMPSSVHRRFQAPVQRVPAEFGHTIESANYRNMLRNPNYAMQQRLPLRNQNKMYQSTYFPSEDYFYNPFQNQQFYFRGQQYYPRVNPYEEFDYQFDYPQVVFFSIRQPYNRNPYLSDAPRPYPLATFNPTVPQEETNREQDAVTPVYIETPFGNSGDLSNNKAETEISEKPVDGVAEQRGEVDEIILQKESAVQILLL